MSLNGIFKDLENNVEERKNELDVRLKEVKTKLEMYKDVPIVKTLLEMPAKKRYYLLEYLADVNFSNSLATMETIIWIYEACFKEGGENYGELIGLYRRGASNYTLYLEDSLYVPCDRSYDGINTEEELINILIREGLVDKQ